MSYHKPSPPQRPGTHYFDNQDAARLQRQQTRDLETQAPRFLRLILPDLTAVLDVPMQPHIVIGRRQGSMHTNRQVDVDLAPFGADKMGVSRYHAIIQASSTRILVQDFNSTNGTYLNGFALDPMTDYRLRHGDELILGRFGIKVHFVHVGASV